MDDAERNVCEQEGFHFLVLSVVKSWSSELELESGMYLFLHILHVLHGYIR